MQKILENFSFGTVTSKGYEDQSIGLYLNLQEIYPNSKLIIACIDSETYTKLGKIKNENLIILDAESIWGERFWRNMSCRMSMAELAYATKSALACFILKELTEYTLIIDSDLLFLDRIDDLILDLKKYNMLLLPARHGLNSWKKSNTFGLFSAGLIGFSRDVISLVKQWKLMCFTDCTIIPALNYFNEQKYLDYFIAEFEAKIVFDFGINLSATTMCKVNLYLNDENKWFLDDGVPVRVYHMSKSTEKPLELLEKKKHINNQGYQLIYGMNKPESSKVVIKSNMLKQIFSLSGCVNFILLIIKFFYSLRRVFSVKQYSLKDRISETFRNKVKLIKELDKLE